MEIADPVEMDALLESIQFRICRPTDIPICLEIETASYPPDEAATLSSLQYRQHHAAPFFLCAVIPGNDETDTVVGFICSTKCISFQHESMTTHVPNGTLLAIHSVVIAEPYRRRGVATRMLREYIHTVKQMDVEHRPEKVVLLAKANLLSFYVNCGFQVMRPSAISHGTDQWYDLEMVLSPPPPTAPESVGRTYHVVDAFADPTRFGTGNPAAVVPLDFEPTTKDHAAWMQTVAQEFNLSETAFVWKMDDTKLSEPSNGSTAQHFGIRYFTPTIEVDLCGHATLASAAVLCENQRECHIVFHAPKDVILQASQVSESAVPRMARIAMSFPTAPVTPITNPDFCQSILCMLQDAFALSKDAIVFIGLAERLGDLLIEVRRDAFLFDPNPLCFNVNALLNWGGYERGVIICCQGEEGTVEGSELTDFCSRFFAPFAGIMEDPVTGSAHCALAPYFGSKLEKTKLVGKQMSPRGGIVLCELSDDMKHVCLTGTAVTTAIGSLWM